MIPHNTIIKIGFSFVFLTSINAKIQSTTELMFRAENTIVSDPKKAKASIIAAADAIKPRDADFKPFSISLKYSE